MSECFPESKPSGGKVKVELDLFNYATKANLKNATYVDTSRLHADKLDINKLKSVPSILSNLKSKVDILYVNKLAIVPVGLSKLSDSVKNYVLKKDAYNARTKKKHLILLTKLQLLLLLLLKMKYLMLVVQSKKLTITQQLVKLKIKLLLILIMINIVLLKNLIS